MRPGFTLLELLIVVAIMGIGAGLVSAVRAPVAAPDADGLSRARRLAMDRAQVLIFARDGSGAWSVEALPHDTLLRGTLPAPQAPLRVRIDPLGRCAPSAPPSRSDVAFDPLACTWREVAR